MLYEAGVDKMYHNRFMDWKDPDYDRRHRQAGTYSKCAAWILCCLKSRKLSTSISPFTPLLVEVIGVF